MATPRTIAVIGACTSNGMLVSKKLAMGTNRLLLTDNNIGKLDALKKEIETGNPVAEVETMECMKEAGWEADIIVLALQWQAEQEIFQLIKPFITGKTVISFYPDNKCLLPYSKVITIEEGDTNWIDEIEKLIVNN